jgi:hypothetical protein
MSGQATYLDLAPVPRSWDEISITDASLEELVLRRTLVGSRTSLTGLSHSLGLPMPMIEAIARELRERKQLDFERMVGLDWMVGLTDVGRAAAHESMRRTRYVGPVPVSLEHYCRVVRGQRLRPMLTRVAVRQAFTDVVVDERLIDELGPAMMSEGAIFVYGPPGTGKSTLAERLARLLGEPVLIPHAVEVDGQVITVFDPTVHTPIDPQPEIDRRWVLCRRPSIVVGGELARSQLDLGYDAQSGQHLAPLQMKANNGVLVIDDFGRQMMTPTELLNRWIVPLDRQLDYLTLSNGVRFDIPFDARVVFSTNLEPSTLGDEAFFRRLPNKVYVGAIDDAQFDTILAGVARARGVGVDGDAAAYLRHLVRSKGDGELRPYVPGVVCNLAAAICRYESIPVRLDRRILDRVASLYFTRMQTPEARSARAAQDALSAVATRHDDAAPVR